MRGTLERVENGKALRTDSVEGEFERMPTRSQRFVLIGKSLTPGHMHRRVETSLVQEITEEVPGVLVFRTENSVYRLRFGA